MRSARQHCLPFGPLLQTYLTAGVPPLAELSRLSGLGPRFEAILAASTQLLHANLLDQADTDRWRDALVRFHAALGVQHADVVSQRAAFLRHAVGSLLRSRESWPSKLHACLSPAGPYRVPGLGPSFWSGVAQGISPIRLPGWTPLIWRGLQRLGLAPLSGAAGPGERYRCLIDAHARLRRFAPQLTALHLDHFLSLVAVMTSRDLFSGRDALTYDESNFIQRDDLRRNLKERGLQIADAQEAFAAALKRNDGAALLNSLNPVQPAPLAVTPALLDWARRFWHDDNPYPAFAEFARQQPLAESGLWFPAAVLHLRDPLRFAPYTQAHRDAQANLDDGVDLGDDPAERYRLFNALCEHLRKTHSLHPLLVPTLLAPLSPSAPQSGKDSPESAVHFAGFGPDTFRFLTELTQNNNRVWMQRQHDRYRFMVREPLVELCRALASNYVHPVLNVRYGYGIDTRPKIGHALTSVVKNSFGRGEPYATTLWITFCRTGRQGAQLFVRLNASGLTYGLAVRDDRGRLRAALNQYAQQLVKQFPDVAEDREEYSIHVPPDDPRLAAMTLADDIIEQFDRLLPLFACCQEDDADTARDTQARSPAPLARCPPWLRPAGRDQVQASYDEAKFYADTWLGPEWLTRAVDLLRIKRQLVLQGVPGTGKTYIALCLARLLTGGDNEAVRVVQFHPGTTYEEFIEGIKVRSALADGRHDVTYPVEEGVLCSFAAQAAAQPDKSFVLVIDELNRGNVPRIFGELLHLLEYRGQVVELPYSRRLFGLPCNLVVIGTMNPVDRSIAPLDQALRRRFSFLTMNPDATVLAAWLAAHSLPDGSLFASQVVGLFVKLNERLRSELGPTAQIGHSHFMVPHLDETRLRLVWTHHIRPLLDDLYAGRLERAEAYDQLLERALRRKTTKEKCDVH